MELSNFRFRDPKLAQVEYLTNGDFAAEQNAEINLPCNISHNVTRHNGDTGANVAIVVTVGEKSGMFPFYISITIESEFDWSESSYSEETVLNLLNRNAPALLLGYARPIVAMITSASKCPVFNVPFIDFTKNPSAQE